MEREVSPLQRQSLARRLFAFDVRDWISCRGDVLNPIPGYRFRALHASACVKCWEARVYSECPSSSKGTLSSAWRELRGTNNESGVPLAASH